jgi:hypothetical protein
MRTVLSTLFLTLAIAGAAVLYLWSRPDPAVDAVLNEALMEKLRIRGYTGLIEEKEAPYIG